MRRFRIGVRGTLAASLLAPMLAFAAPPAHAKSGTGASILVIPFDFFDTAADQRPQIVADQHGWLKQAVIRLRHDLSRKPGLHVINTAQARHAFAGTVARYAHPSSCPSCLLADARAAGARYVLVPELHRVSDLILYMRVTLYEVGANQAVFGHISEVKADNRRMIMRATDSMAQTVGTALAKRPGASPQH